MNTTLNENKEWLPIWCESCQQMGFIFVDDPDQAYFVICKKCGAEYSQVWCPACGMGGDFVRNIARRPSSWNCHDCKENYPLPPGFYTQPVDLLLEDMLPANVVDRIKSTFQPKEQITPGKLLKILPFLLMVVTVMMGSLFFPPAALAFVFPFLRLGDVAWELIMCFGVVLWFPIWVILMPRVEKLIDLIGNWMGGFYK